MAEAANLLRNFRDKEEEKGGVAKDFLDQIEEALDEAESQEILSTQKLDTISIQKEQERKNVPQRPKLTYNIFDGTQNNWSTFRKNQEQIFEYISDNPVQQLHQLSKICSPQIAATILSFNTSEKALDWLILKYGVPHLQIPQVYKEIKSLTKATNKYEIPQTTEVVLVKLESLTNLIQSED